jgi:hypothetical protein
MKKPVLIVIDLQNNYIAGGRWTQISTYNLSVAR